MFRQIKYVIGTTLLCWGLTSCENNMQEIKQLNEKFEAAVETLQNPRLIYSDRGLTRIVLEAPKLLRYKTDDPYTEFPEGLKVTFFDNYGQPNSTLIAKYGIKREKSQETIVRNNVVWQNLTKNERMETEELRWEEERKKIVSYSAIKLSTDTEVLFGEGFEAEQDFSRYKIKRITGTMKVPKNSF